MIKYYDLFSFIVDAIQYSCNNELGIKLREVDMSDKTETVSINIIKLPPIPTEVEEQWDSEVHECRRAVERTSLWWNQIKELNNIA